MLEFDNSRIQALVDRPSETLSVEIKTWFDPDALEGQAKLVRGMLSLRNYDGGLFLVGFDDELLVPDLTRVPDNVMEVFHPDKIHSLIGRFASEPFEVAVRFVARDGINFPVIAIPSGVRTPIAAKSDIIVEGKKVVAVGDVYFRSPNTNRRPSSARANWNDWPSLMDICVHNREADIGCFLRRHLSGLSAETVREALGALDVAVTKRDGIENHLQEILDQGKRRFSTVVVDRSVKLPTTGFWEVAMFVNGPVAQQSLNTFLHLLSATNPEYTGWPMWLVRESFADESDRPHIYNGLWEALVVLPKGRQTDFMQFDPRGAFYQLRVLFDDLQLTNNSPAPGTALDLTLPVLDCTEAIAVGLAFAKAMGCAEETSTLEFAFRWSGLQGRELTSWTYPGRYLSPGRKAYQDEITLCASVPLSTPPSAIGGLLTPTLAPLYALFSAFDLGSNVIEDLSTQLIERRARV